MRAFEIVETATPQQSSTSHAVKKSPIVPLSAKAANWE
jgi:hypothetical protein